MTSLREGLLEKIKKRGFWLINFKPLVYNSQRIQQIPDCKNIIEKNRVEFRGWDYPHFPQRQDNDTGLIPGNNYYEGWIDWSWSKEVWRMYQSGQFIHYLSLMEDWDDLGENVQPKTILSIIMTVYHLTEIFEFLARLTQSGVYEEGVKISISLNNTIKRELKILGHGRVPLHGEYVAHTNQIKFENQYSKNLITSNPKELALDVSIYFFNRFGWDNPSKEVIKNDQEKLIKGL